MSTIWDWITYKPSPLQRDPRAKDTQSDIRIGTVLQVNPEKMTCDISMDYIGVDLFRDVPLGFPFVTRRGFMGGMPEAGSKAILLLLPASNNSKLPIIISFLPPYFPVLAYNHDRVNLDREEVPGFSATKSEVRLRNQRLYPGELFLGSDQGSDIRIDDDIHITNQKLTEIQLRSSDQSIVLNSLQYYRATDASVKIEGMVTRYMETPYNSDGQLLDKSGNPHYNFGFDNFADTEARLTFTDSTRKSISAGASLVTPDLNQNFIMLDDGLFQWVRTLSGKTTIDDPYITEVAVEDLQRLKYASLPLTESRHMIKELGDGVLDQSYPFLQNDLDVRNSINGEILSILPSGTYLSKNIIESVQGTLVGYDFFGNPNNYGKVLRHELFTGPDTTAVNSREISIEGDNFPDFAKTRTWAVASMWKMPSTTSQTRFYVNKEGYISFHIGSTRPQIQHVFKTALADTLSQVAANPVGAGRSVEGSFGGSVRLLVEKDYKEESLELTALGRSFINLGCDDRTDYGFRPRTYMDGREVPVGVFEADELVRGRGGYTSNSERISLDMTTDGGLVLRIGKNSQNLVRKFRHNGYDAKGRTLNTDRYQTSKNLSKATFYTGGEDAYQFHDMSLPSIRNSYKFANPTPVISNTQQMASSLDAHLCGDAMLRIGADSIDNRSLVLDLAGALVAAIGKDSHDSRSIQAVLDGGIEIDVGRMGKTGNAIQGVLRGDVDLRILASNPHPNENGGGAEAPSAHKDKSGYGLTTSGFRHKLHKGSIKSSIEGTFDTNIQGSQKLKIGGVQSVSVNGDISHFTLGGYKLNIGNSAFALGNLNAYDVSAAVGTLRSSTLLGDIKSETKAGNIVVDTLLGNMDFKTKAGSITISTLAGNFDGSTILGNASISTKIGNASMTTNLGNVEVSTTLGNATFSTQVGVAALKSQILAQVVSEALVQINAKLTTVNSNIIQLGGPSSIHPVPKGDQLLMWLATHVHGTPGTPPVVPPTPALLSTVTLTS